MNKTASQIGDIVLEKCAISAGKVYRAMERSAGPGYFGAVDRLRKSPKASKIIDYVGRKAHKYPGQVTPAEYKALLEDQTLSRRVLGG